MRQAPVTSDADAGSFAGGLVGVSQHNESGSISITSSCYATGSVTASSTLSQSFVGGLIGSISGGSYGPSSIGLAMRQGMLLLLLVLILIQVVSWDTF